MALSNAKYGVAKNGGRMGGDSNQNIWVLPVGLALGTVQAAYRTEGGETTQLRNTDPCSMTTLPSPQNGKWRTQQEFTSRVGRFKGREDPPNCHIYNQLLAVVSQASTHSSGTLLSLPP